MRVVDKRSPVRGVRIYVGRPSVLGNPFPMASEADRARVISEYRAWLRARYAEKGDVYCELIRIAGLVKAGQDVELACWCAPRACHGDVIAAAIRGMLSIGVV